MRTYATMANLFGAVLLLNGACASVPAAAQSRAWNFEVLLNDAPIGYHRFTLREQGGQRQMKIEARFDVKVLVFNAYRYTHDATESWHGNCLESLASRTDDNGELFAVDAVRQGERIIVTTTKDRDGFDGCIMSFAYWNPEILRQSRLLNAQTGEYEAIKVAALADESIAVRGAPVMAKHYRITGLRNPIDLWYSADHEWLALESTVAGGRRLRYRLKT